MGKEVFGTDTRVLSGYLVTSYNSNQNLIRLADTKANIVLALIGVILSMFFNFFVIEQGGGMMEVIVVLVPFVISGYFAFSTLFPRGGRKTGKVSLLYFKDAEDVNREKLIGNFKKGFDKEIVKDYVGNIKALAGIVERKFRNLRYAYFFLGIAVLVKVLVEFRAWLGL